MLVRQSTNSSRLIVSAGHLLVKGLTEVLIRYFLVKLIWQGAKGHILVEAIQQGANYHFCTKTIR